MIDFRYHLVSIVAVFLALAVGIVLGSTALKPSVLNGLNKASAAEKRQIDGLYAANRLQRQQISGDQAFAKGVSAQLVGGLLTGQRVVLVTAPGAPGGVTSGITTALQGAGATVSGRVELTSRFFDPSPATGPVLSKLTQQYLPAGQVLPDEPAVQQASQLLAAAVMTAGGAHDPAPGQADKAGLKILAGLGSAGLLTHTGQPGNRATLAVVIIPATPPKQNASPVSQGLVTMAQQFKLGSQGAVVAGSTTGSGQGSAIDVMRAGGRAGHISSVDDADTVIGQLVVAQALWEQLQGRSGSYGVGAAANGPGPSPAPTPSPSVSSPGGRQGASVSIPTPRASASRTARR